MKRVYCYYGPTRRLDGAPFMLYQALSRIPGVEVFHAECHGTPELMGRGDLHIAVDWAEDVVDGGKYAAFIEPRPLVYWMSDTHVAPEGRAFRLSKAARADHVYCAIHSDEFTWLPYAAEPLIFHPDASVEPTYDVVFVGHTSNYPEREVFLEHMCEAFPNFSIQWGAYFELGASLLRTGKVILNHCWKDSVNQRVFEGMAMGQVVLTNATSDHLSLGLVDGVNLATYRTYDEAVEKVNHYLLNEDARVRVGAAALEWVLAGHTYIHRAVRILRETGIVNEPLDLPQLIATPPFKGIWWGDHNPRKHIGIAV